MVHFISDSPAVDSAADIKPKENAIDEKVEEDKDDGNPQQNVLKPPKVNLDAAEADGDDGRGAGGEDDDQDPAGGLFSLLLKCRDKSTSHLLEMRIFLSFYVTVMTSVPSALINSVRVSGVKTVEEKKDEAEVDVKNDEYVDEKKLEASDDRKKD